MDELSLALQRALTHLESTVSARHRDPADLLVVDGPLRGRAHQPRTVGYIKTHHTSYLPAPNRRWSPPCRPPSAPRCS